MVRTRLAIDFGTTNSVIAQWDDARGAARALSIPTLSAPAQNGRQPLIPSLLYVCDGRSREVVLGQAVLDEGLERQAGNRLFRSFKRGILSRVSAEPRLIDGVPWSDADAGRCFFQALLGSLPCAAEEIEQLVVTVPVAAFEGYVAWLSEGLQDLSPQSVRLVDESTAAALGYSVTQPGAVVLVFDFGGGSLDISLVQLPESQERAGGLLHLLRGKPAGRYTARVISKAGLSLGGSDIDQYLLAEVLRRTGLEPGLLGLDYAAVLTACEAVKISLSTEEEAVISFEYGGRAYFLPFTRLGLEALLQENGFYTAIRRLIEKVMHVAQRQGVFKEDIQHVLMVGGASLIPSVQGLLRSTFSPESVHVEKPFTAIAEGALQIAAGFGLEDYLAHSYGLRYLDPRTGRTAYDEIIPMGSRYPSSRPVEVLLSAAHPQQETVEFIVGEIDADAVSMVEVKYEHGQTVFVARSDPAGQQVIPMNAAAPARVRLSPPGQPGKSRLRATFYVDGQRQLRLSVFDLRARKELLQDVVLTSLQEDAGGGTPLASPSGCEPGLATRESQQGLQRLSLRGLGTVLNALPPNAISLAAAAEALRSTDFYVRFSAARLLSQRGDRDARRVMLDILENGTAPQRAGIAYHLHRFSWFVAEPLLRQALADQDLRVRESAVYALCQLRSFEAIQLLLEVLPGAPGGASPPAEALCMAAAWGLSASPDAACVPVLEAVMRACDPEIRVKALEALGASQAPQAVPVVRRHLDDESLDVQYATVLSWIELEGEACFAELASRVEASSGRRRQTILQAFFHATNYLFIDVAASPFAGQVIAALGVALTDELPAARLAAAMPLSWMRSPEAGDALLAAYRQEADGEVQARILFAAVQLGSPAGETLLQEALSGSCQPPRQVAEQILAGRPQV